MTLTLTQTGPDTLLTRVMRRFGKTADTSQTGNGTTINEVNHVPTTDDDLAYSIYEPRRRQSHSVRVATQSTSDQLPKIDKMEAITSQDNSDGLMVQLAAAAAAGDEKTFLIAYQLIDWHKRRPDEVLQAIQWAFAAGAHMAARHLAMRGAKRYPHHDELQKYARILAPPRVIARHLPTDSSIQANQTWLRNQSAQYRGKWVALLNGTLLSTADALADLIHEYGVKKEVFYTKVV